MNKRIAKPLCFFLTLIMLTGVVVCAPLTVSAADPAIVRYNCGLNGGTNVEGVVFPDTSMAFFGTGEMENYTLNNGHPTAPWLQQNVQYFCQKVAVEYGVTSIGDYSFYLKTPYASIFNIDISNTVTSIGKYAFYGQTFQQIVIPPSVTHIGANAFKGSQLDKDNGIIYYGDPSDLVWDVETVNPEFPTKMKVHIFDDYSANVSEFNTKFSANNIEFAADIDNPYAQAGEDIDRNIAVYYSSVNSNVFAGAAPFVIVGKFGERKSVTYCSNGFVSCVKQGNEYYLLTDNTKGTLYKATFSKTDTTGKATGYDSTEKSDLELKISHEYIGSNTVKMIYTLTNKGTTELSNIKVGGTGDIKIGADDKAAIVPLYENGASSGTQVGFYMKSGQTYDKVGDDYATLGFIGKKVDLTSSTVSPNANFFYGTVAVNKDNSAAGSKNVTLIPERIFEKNTGTTGTSYDSGEFNQNSDSGMSFHWDGITLAANESKQFAVLFSVYGAQNGNKMFEEIDANNFCTVTWKNWDGTVLHSQVVRKGTTPDAYSGATPTRPRDDQNNEYTFSGWDSALGVVNSDTVYTAQFTSQHCSKLFTGHSLTLGGDIGLNFYLNVTPDQIAKGSGVVVDFEWTVKGVKQTSQVTLDTSKYTEVTEEGEKKTYYLAQLNLPAAEMAYNIHATAKINGKLQAETDDYSVKAYGEEIVGSDKYDEKLKTLIKEMLNYGAKSQVVFDRVEQSSPLANSGIAGYEMSYDFGNNKTFAEAVNAAVAAEADNNGNTKTDMREGAGDFGLNYLGSSQVYLTTTTLRHYYTVSDQEKYNTAKNNNAGLFVESKPPFVFVDFTGIPSDKLDLLKEFTVAGHTYRFSVLDYAAAMYEAGNDDEKALAVATYWYNNAANAYFDQ